MKDFAKSIHVGNGLKEDLLKRDSLARDVKPSASYEAIAKQPWRVYEILGVDDSVIREEAFDLVAKKYGVAYDTLYYAWLHRGFKLSDYKSPTKEDQAKKDFQKLGITVTNSKAGNSKVGNFTINEGVKGKEELNTKYKDNIRAAKEALSRISRKISEYENKGNINWGHLGDIAHIAEQLKEIA